MFSQNQEEVKLEWMYKGTHSTVNREEYLLGRSVDKTLEQVNLEEKQQQLGIQQPKNHVEHECIPPSIRNYQEQLGEQVDINAKLQEDPLIAIRKREEENRRQFLNNPVQIKKLQKALKLQKNKKKKKQKHSDNDSDEDLDKKIMKKLKSLKSSSVESKKPKASKALDTILMHKYNQLKTQLTGEDIQDILQGKVVSSSSSSSSSSGSDDTEEDLDDKKSRKKFKSKSNSNYNRRAGRSQSRERHEYKKKSANKKRSRSRSYEKNRQDDSKSNKKRKSRSSSREKRQKHFRRQRSSSEDSDSDSNYSKKRKNYGLVKADGTKIPFMSKQGTSSHGKAYQSHKVQNVKVASGLPKRSTLTEEEKEKKRLQMMQNATWRDSERAKNVKRYREIDLKEARAQEDYDPEFLQKQLLKSANNSSVESRIKANINNIQRSKNDMNRHFSKR